MKEHYNIFIEEEVVNEAQKYYQEYGGKLSPLIEKLLIRWIKEQENKK
mgnify:CR=1 FL=1